MIVTARGDWGKVAEANMVCVAIGSIVSCPLWMAAMIERLESQLRAAAKSRRIVGSLGRHQKRQGGSADKTYVSSTCNLAMNGSPNNEFRLGA